MVREPMTGALGDLEQAYTEIGRLRRDYDVIADIARELAGLARFHAMHDGVSPGDRARIAGLCDRLGA